MEQVNKNYAIEDKVLDIQRDFESYVCYKYFTTCSLFSFMNPNYDRKQIYFFSECRAKKIVRKTKFAVSRIKACKK